MKKRILSLITMVLLIVSLSGCGTIKGIFGKSSTAENNAKAKIELVTKSLNINSQQKMDQVAVLASGTDYALTLVTNKEPSLVVAKDINNRVVSLAGKPDLNAEKEMWKTVDQLSSDLVKEREKGIISLGKKDSEITLLQSETKVLLTAKDVEIDKYIKLASSTAMKADKLKMELDDYQGWFGLKAVGKGLWQFITSSMWVLGIGGVLFLILRVFAASNPIAGAAFSIFNVIGGYCIKAVNVIIPKAVEFSGHIATSAYNESKQLLTKIVDSIESIKNIEKSTGQLITLKQLFVELDKTMDTKEKEVIDNIKKKLGY